MFKKGQRVVFVTDEGCDNSRELTPIIGNIYTIEYVCHDGWVAIHGFYMEYESLHFRPLNDDFAERILSEIKEQIENEELVLLNKPNFIW